MNYKEKAEKMIEEINSNISPMIEYGNSRDMSIYLALQQAKITYKELCSIPKYATCNKFEFKKEFWKDVRDYLQIEYNSILS